MTNRKRCDRIEKLSRKTSEKKFLTNIERCDKIVKRLTEENGAHRTLKIKQRKQEKEPVILLRNTKYSNRRGQTPGNQKSESAKREMSIQSSKNDLNARKGD